MSRQAMNESTPGSTLQSEPVWVIPLHDPAAADTGLAGGKAANLARLLAAGFPVPEGVVVTTAAFAAHTAAVRTDGASAAQAIMETPLPQPVVEALTTALSALGDAPLAVRSSGVAEDLAGASFAGQYETVLGVRGEAAALDAVRRCWASAFSRHLTAYRESRAVAGARMAVLIQPLVAADAAGVAFTANPVTGDRTETMVSAVRGLGDRLVSGDASPDEWVVRDGEAVCRSAPEGAIGAGEVLAVADLARRAEVHFGTPQDIEWAISNVKLCLLQSRPITTLPDTASLIPVPVAPPPGFWERETSHFPQPLYPMTRSIWLEAENHAFRRTFAEFSMLLDTLEVREIGGWIYQRLVPLGGRDRPPPPAWLWPLLIRTVPPLRARIRGCVEAMRADKLWQFVERWYGEWKPGLIQRMAALRAVDLPGLSDGDLDRHAGGLTTLVWDSLEIHMLINFAQNILLAEFFFTCQDLLGWDEHKAVELLSGLSDTSNAPARALADLAQQVRDNPTLSRLLEQVDGQTPARLAEADPDFGAAFDRYLWEYGCRAIRYETADPTVSETPGWILGLLCDQLKRGYSPAADAAALAERRTRLAAEARAALAGRPAAERERFDRALARAERVYPLREEHGFYDASAPLALVRYAALELGRRLVERGQMAHRDDVFFLELDEARTALRDGDARHQLVQRRQGERAWVLAHPGPASYGTPPPPPPSFAALPPEARFVHEAVMWIVERVFATEVSGRRQTDPGALSGIPASAGVCTGPVRVVRDESEFHKIQAGDVLVCPITSPVWSVLFPNVDALVTDSGGILSHSAIIAREYGIPAVVATGNATALLRDGQIVTVDGGSGTVRALI